MHEHCKCFDGRCATWFGVYTYATLPKYCILVCLHLTDQLLLNSGKYTAPSWSYCGTWIYRMHVCEPSLTNVLFVYVFPCLSIYLFFNFTFYQEYLIRIGKSHSNEEKRASLHFPYLLETTFKLSKEARLRRPVLHFLASPKTRLREQKTVAISIWQRWCLPI